MIFLFPRTTVVVFEFVCLEYEKLSSKMVQMGEQIHKILLNFQHMHLNQETKTGWSRVLSNASCLFC